MKLHEIREQKAKLTADARKLVETETMTAEQRTQFDKIKADIVELEAQEQRTQFIEDQERNQRANPIEKQEFANLEQNISVREVIAAQAEQRAITGAAAEYAKETEKRTGKKAQGFYVPLSTIENRADNVNTTQTAKEIVPTIHRADLFITPFRNNLLARQLGVQVLSGLSGNLSIPRYGESLSVGWVAENTAIPDSKMKFGEPLTLTPKHAGGITEMSRQLLQQSSPDIENLIRGDLSYLLAQAIDSALISGGGANEPTGVLKTVGIQTGSLAAMDYESILKMIELAELKNAGVYSWIFNPTVKRILASTLKAPSTVNEYLLSGSRLGDLPAYVTNQMPADTAILGDWSQVYLGIWGEVDLLVNPYDSEAYKRGGVKVRAMTTVDIGVRHAESFVVATDAKK